MYELYKHKVYELLCTSLVCIYCALFVTAQHCMSDKERNVGTISRTAMQQNVGEI